MNNKLLLIFLTIAIVMAGSISLADAVKLSSGFNLNIDSTAIQQYHINRLNVLIGQYDPTAPVLEQEQLLKEMVIQVETAKLVVTAPSLVAEMESLILIIEDFVEQGVQETPIQFTNDKGDTILEYNESSKQFNFALNDWYCTFVGQKIQCSYIQ